MDKIGSGDFTIDTLMFSVLKDIKDKGLLDTFITLAIKSTVMDFFEDLPCYQEIKTEMMIEMFEDFYSSIHKLHT